MSPIEATITHVFGDIVTRETFGNYAMSTVRGTRERHTICPTGECPSLLEDFRMVATDSFGAEMQAGGSSGVWGVVYNKDLLVIIHDNREIYAFAAAQIRAELSLCYLHGLAIKNSFQSRGMGRALVECRLRQQPYDKVALTTQNPVMYCLLRKMFRKVYPSSDRRAVSRRIQDISKRLRGRNPNFDRTTFVITDMYQECLYASIPRANDAEVNAFFTERLGIRNNTTRNGFLVIAENKL